MSTPCALGPRPLGHSFHVAAARGLPWPRPPPAGCAPLPGFHSSCASRSNSRRHPECQTAQSPAFLPTCPGHPDVADCDLFIWDGGGQSGPQGLRENARQPVCCFPRISPFDPRRSPEGATCPRPHSQGLVELGPDSQTRANSLQHYLG